MAAGVKVIISRKGFDSAYGRVPSPILPDGRMIALPIPDKDAPMAYDAIQRDNIALASFVTDLKAKRGKPAKLIVPTDRAHLDPDLDQQAVPRPDGWRPIFGQSGAALSHLMSSGVGVGDLFLFFGWFRRVEAQDGHWRYVRGADSVHALWGWMRVGAVHPVDATLPADVRRWAAGHPHLHGEQPRDNSVIVAADTVEIGGRRLPGAGIFTSRSERVLTVAGENRSSWCMPAWMRPDAGHATLTYHGDQKRWTEVTEETCRMRAVDIGQEFVLDTQRADLLDRWLAGLFGDVPAV